jgi:hypothetical protein
MATMEQFSRNMQALSARIEKRGPAIVRKVAADCLRLVVLATPVGNPGIWAEPDKAPAGYVGGRARANWFVGLGSAPADVTENIDASGGSTIQNGVSTILGAGAGSSIHLVNNLPYIKPLNDGHSHQAPAGFVDLAVHNAIAGLATQKVTEEGKDAS